MEQVERLFWCNVGYATFGIISVNNVITKAAPIAAWMVGKRLVDIKPFLLRKQAKVIEIK